MQIIESLPLLRQQIQCWQQDNKRIALVPTMGNLHDGHLALFIEAKANADIVVVSIFVNPMQFERQDDLVRYPRTLQEDCEKLNRHQVDLIFAPTTTDIYPDGMNKHSYVEVQELSTMLEGASRPDHFRGVSTIVSKLFNLIQPDVACFGKKDYQQLALIRKMVMDMGYPVNIIGVPIVRAKTGLDLSSRNNNLTQEDHKLAPYLHKIMNELAQKLSQGERHFDDLLANSTEQLQITGFKSVELFIRDADTLQSINSDSKRAIILMAAWLGKIRLIDNQQVDLLE